MSVTSIFTPRVAFKPFEYPEVLKYRDAINHSYWLVSEWNFISDVQDFHTRLNDVERNAIKNTLLAISQIEVAVKKFWGKLGDRFPKAEFDQVGATFSECEVRHSSAYSHLLEVLNLNEDFNTLLEVPAIRGRVDYLTKYINNSPGTSSEKYMMTLTLFSMFVENISLFSQFAIMKSFNKYKNTLKDIDNVVQATMKEEQVHALLGIYIIEQIKQENPSWFNEEFYEKVYRASEKALRAECDIIDWIFENGELSFLSKETLKEYIKQRFNESLRMIGGKDLFDVDENQLAELQWFDDELYGEVSTDFFHKRPVSYSKKMQSITAEDLF